MPAGANPPIDDRQGADWLTRCWRYAIWTWLVVAPIFAAIVVTKRRDELEQIGAALWSADPRWIAVAVGIESLTIFAAGLSYKLLLRRLGYGFSCLALASAHLQRCAAGAISPLSGPTSVCVLLHLLARRRVATQDAVLTIGLRSVAGQIAFVLTLVVALVLLQPVVALWTLGAVLAVVALSFPLRRLGGWRPGAVLCRIESFCLRHLPRRPARWLGNLGIRIRQHRLTPHDISWPTVLAAGGRVGSIAILIVSLQAVGVDASVGTAVAVYLAALVAHITLPIFGGAGLVEGAATAALIQSGIPAEVAVGAVLLWRLIDFWLPLAVGLAAHAGAFVTPLVPQPALPDSTIQRRPLPASHSRAALAPGALITPHQRRLGDIGP